MNHCCYYNMFYPVTFQTDTGLSSVTLFFWVEFFFFFLQRNVKYNVQGKITAFVVACSDDTQEGRKIRISKNGTLNIYIAVDISESIEDTHFTDARNAVAKLISKVRTKQLSSWLKNENKNNRNRFVLTNQREIDPKWTVDIKSFKVGLFF